MTTLCKRVTNVNSTQQLSLSVVSTRHLGSSRTHIKDWRPKPNQFYSDPPLIPARKRKAILLNPTPVVSKLTDHFPEFKFKEIYQEYTDEEWERRMSESNEIRTDVFDMAGAGTDFRRLRQPKVDLPKRSLNELIQQSKQHTLKKKEISKTKGKNKNDDDEDNDNNNDNDQPAVKDPKVWKDVWPYKSYIWQRSKVNLDKKVRTFNPDHRIGWWMDDKDDKVGRAWYSLELRLKSNHDLWKLWYVMLREKNMLNTLRFECRATRRLMPNYGRYRKVCLSMARLKVVWDERARIKYRNRRSEHDKIREVKRNTAIEHRRLRMLKQREKIKALYRAFAIEQGFDWKKPAMDRAHQQYALEKKYPEYHSHRRTPRGLTNPSKLDYKTPGILAHSVSKEVRDYNERFQKQLKYEHEQQANELAQA